MGNRKVRLGISELVWKKRITAMGNRKVRLGISELVWKKADNGNGEP